MNNLSHPTPLADSIPLEAIRDGSAVSKVNYELIEQLERDQKTADTSTLNRMIALALTLPFGFVFLVLTFTLGPKLILKLGFTAIFLKLAKNMALTGRLLAGILTAKKTGKAVIMAGATIVGAFAVAPLTAHRKRLHRHLLTPLLNRIDEVSLTSRREIESHLGCTIKELLRHPQLQRRMEFNQSNFKHAVALTTGDLTVFVVPIQFAKWRVFSRRWEITFQGTALLTRFPETATNSHLFHDWYSAGFDDDADRPPRDPLDAIAGGEEWRRELARNLMASVDLADAGKRRWQRHGMAFSNGRFVALTHPIQILDHAVIMGTRPIGDVLSRFFSGLRRVAEAGTALDAASRYRIPKS